MASVIKVFVFANFTDENNKYALFKNFALSID